MNLRPACRAAGIGVVSISEHVGPARAHRAVPTLSARLVVGLGAPLEVDYGGQTLRTQAVVAGLMRPGLATPVTTLLPRQPTAYVELSASALRRLIGMPLSEVDAGGVIADAVLPWVRSMCEELAEHPAARREAVLRIRLLDQLNRAGYDTTADHALRALDLIRAGGGTASVDDLADHVHLSARRLREVMRRSLGVTPKFASRVARLECAVHRAGTGATSWAQVAAESGYHDQSHLVREFRDLMNTTPTDWLAEEGRNLQGRQSPVPRPWET
ncbi:helix-turn-helix domain-containing protein [Nocardia sp. NPDC055165]|uniref:helix-turn-helix domain-containing protein n=1 Tax=Nocardia sp. NPDC060220 TaxID=3347076 RepID=UPI00364B9526